MAKRERPSVHILNAPSTNQIFLWLDTVPCQCDHLSVNLLCPIFLSTITSLPLSPMQLLLVAFLFFFRNAAHPWVCYAFALLVLAHMARCVRPNFLFDTSHAYLVYIIIIIIWNHIDCLRLAHLKVFALIFSYLSQNKFKKHWNPYTGRECRAQVCSCKGGETQHCGNM